LELDTGCSFVCSNDNLVGTFAGSIKSLKRAKHSFVVDVGRISSVQCVRRDIANVHSSVKRVLSAVLELSGEQEVEVPSDGSVVLSYQSDWGKCFGAIVNGSVVESLPISSSRKNEASNGQVGSNTTIFDDVEATTLSICCSTSSSIFYCCCGVERLQLGAGGIWISYNHLGVASSIYILPGDVTIPTSDALVSTQVLSEKDYSSVDRGSVGSSFGNGIGDVHGEFNSVYVSQSRPFGVGEPEQRGDDERFVISFEHFIIIINYILI